MDGADDAELRRLAREAVSDAAPDVLAEAMRRAREKAVARLADLLADALVEEALATRREPDTENRHLYAYALIRAGHRLPADLPALTAERCVTRVVDGDLALLVSPVTPGQLQVDQDDLAEDGRLATLVRGHDAVLRAAADAGAVLPLRFGTVVPSEEAARRLLREHAEAAVAQLARVDGAREWGVRLLRPVGAEPQPAGPAPRREGMSGTEYLTSRRTALAARERADDDARHAAARLEETLAPHVTEFLRRGGSPGSSLLLDAACLVARDSEAAFTGAVTGLAEELRHGGLDVELTGPWPPYSFVSLEAGDG